MLFQGSSILKFSCASGANNRPHQFRRLDTRFIIAASETTLNIAKNFVRKYSKLFGNFSTAPPHSSDVRYGPDFMIAWKSGKTNGCYLDVLHGNNNSTTRLKKNLTTSYNDGFYIFMHAL